MSTPPREFLVSEPTNRDKYMKCRTIWLAGKRKDDDVGDYWRIHDKLYDLSSFIHKHPGGQSWLVESRGIDITESFESSHWNPAVREVLKKYYVKDAEKPRNAPYTFHENGFYKTLQRRAFPILSKAGSGPTLKMKLYADGAVTFFVILLSMSAYLHSFIFAALAGLLLVTILGIGHNFSHQKDNFRMYYFNLSFSLCDDLRVIHAMSHHVFTNTRYDYEITLFEPFIPLMSYKEKNFLTRLLLPSLFHFIVFNVALPCGLILRLIFFLIGRVKPMFSYCLPYFQIAWMMLLAGDYYTGFKFWLFMTFCHNILNNINNVVGQLHHHPDIYHANDTFRTNPDWGLCQLDATRDRFETNHSLFLRAAFYGDHSLHHMFPTVDQSKLPLLYTVFMKTLKDFDIPYSFFTSKDFTTGYFRLVWSTRPNKNPPGHKKEKERILPLDYLNAEKSIH